MKNITFGLITMSSITAIAAGPFSGREYEFCKKQVTSRDGYSIACKGAKDFDRVMAAKKRVARKIPFRTLDVIDAEYGFEIMPDADTNHIYNFSNALLDNSAETIGYIDIDGYENSEMEYKMQISARYNTKGELVFATIKD